MRFDCLCVAACLLASACTGQIVNKANSGGTTDEACPAQSSTVARTPVIHDRMSPGRLLRRAMLSVTGTSPTVDQYEKLAVLTTDEARATFVKNEVHQALQSPVFYSKMVEFGHDWIKVAEYTTGAQGDAYQGNMSGDLFQCDSKTKHPGAYCMVNEVGGNNYECSISEACNDLDAHCQPIPIQVRSVEPWWAPGTQVTVIGHAATDITTIDDSAGNKIDCGISSGGYYDPGLPQGCSCGKNLQWCYPVMGLNGGSSIDTSKQRRQPWEEPARLFAHLAWHDRPLTDLVLGNYSVGNNMLRALYLRMGRQNGENASLDANTTWWRPNVGNEPRDPQHPDANDPGAWREFVVSTLNPNVLSLTTGDVASGSLDRSYGWDPRVSTTPLKGLPAAGVLTMMGFLSTFARERPRAARALEMFGCEEFTPPDAAIKFPPYDRDPATSGTCMNCHQTLDPAALFFKRWDFGGNYLLFTPFMPGVGPWKFSPVQFSGQYPYDAAPYGRWVQAWVPDTVLTPVSAAEVAAHPDAIMLDSIPAGQTYLGQTSDGTIGPFGFAKLLVKSGAFDRCATSRIYERFVGHKLDPGKEALYLNALTARFVEGGRTLRPFVEYLVTTGEFGRGI